MTLLNGPDKDMKAVKKRRESLFGPDMPPMSIPDTFQEISMVRDIGMNIGTYRDLPIHDRAQIIAHYRISNMMETYRRHAEINAESEKRAMEGANKKR